ncbi:E1B 19K [simian adenovirus 58]|uniref:E1B protein, small T-antigen n=1 Tax=simian adenovirus 58 TaxID=3071241 RepID=A0A2H5AI99_9ADEN|nr:E1B 19K [Rhesus adenovirus 58]
MDLLKELRDFDVVRQLLESASDKTSKFWRFCFGSTLSNVVYRVKKEQAEQFSRLLAEIPGVFVALDLGHHALFQEKVIKSLTFSSPGRVVTSLAFICHLLDKWSSDSHLSWNYMLDYLSMAVWRAMLRKRVCIYLRAQPPRLDRVEEEDEPVETDNPRAGLDPPVED